MIAKPLVIKRDGYWRICTYLDMSPVKYRTWREAYTHALRYA